VILAQIRGFVSRPIAPTRRLSLGTVRLPFEAPDLHGALLCGAIAAEFFEGLDSDRRKEFVRLMDAVSVGSRIVQPALRHRLQEDRVGLRPVSLSLTARRAPDGTPTEPTLELTPHRPTDGQALLLMLYGVASLPVGDRLSALSVVRRGVERPFGARRFVADAGHAWIDGSQMSTVGDREWAARTLGISDLDTLSRQVVLSAYRIGLRSVHPDHGGDLRDAPARIAALSEARRILEIEVQRVRSAAAV
jgi:hypothetical protein